MTHWYTRWVNSGENAPKGHKATELDNYILLFDLIDNFVAVENQFSNQLHR